MRGCGGDQAGQSGHSCGARGRELGKPKPNNDDDDDDDDKEDDWSSQH